MATKKQSKKSVKKAFKQNVDEKAMSDVQRIQDNPDENPFDFGGIPARDLKKNLGCG